MRARSLAVLAFAGAAAACATLGSTGQGDVDLPSTGVGPFRKLGAAEVHGVAPFVLEDTIARYREPAVLPVTPEDRTATAVYLYAVARQGGGDAGPATDVIVRTRADDARSFFGTAADFGHSPAVVLRADLPWEGGNVAGPAAVRANGQVLLFYSAQGGIGVAASSDGGLTFAKQPLPVLAPDPSVAWETTTPTAPSVAVLPDGRFRMLYAAGVSIGEAESNDGIAFHRVDANPSTPAVDPVLGPGAPRDPATLAPGEKPPFDTAQVTDPCLAPRVTAAGRLQYRVLYTGYADPPGTPGRNGTIGFAARYGDEGPLSRQANPLYSVSKHEAAPALFEWGTGAGTSMLYVQQDDTTTSTATATAVAAAVAPAALTLEPPGGYPSSP